MPSRRVVGVGADLLGWIAGNEYAVGPREVSAGGSLFRDQSQGPAHRREWVVELSAPVCGGDEMPSHFEKSQMTRQLRQIEQTILAKGKVDSQDLDSLRRLLHANSPIDRPQADFLVELHKRLQHRTPDFEQFFFQAIKGYLLADGWIDAEHAGWLRRMLYSDGKIGDDERKFLHELKGEVKHVSREFELLLAQSMH